MDILRKKTFDNTEDDEIDIYEIKTREWGHLYILVAGYRMGGDYTHIIIDHTGMLLRRHRYETSQKSG